MQDEVRDKSVALVIRVGKEGGRLTADLLKAAMLGYEKLFITGLIATQIK